jgi:3-oxoacyl-[acyl-carrier protein] reductase
LADLSNYHEVEKLVEDAENKLGHIDILINNAGITDDNIFLRMSDDQWSNVINFNLNSTFKITKAVVKGMVKRRYGRIINITSVIGTLGAAGQANYSASKAALIGMSKSLAQEVGSRSITVNCIAPGFIETNMTADLSESRKAEILKSITLKRFGLPEDVSSAVSFLASDSASYITGQTIHINGGMLMV